MVCYDYLNFKLLSIRLKRQIYFKGFFYIILILYSSFTEYESIFVSATFFEIMCNLSTCHFKNLHRFKKFIVNVPIVVLRICC
jgi:hypothetical protein